MKVKDLIEKLQNVDQEAEVVVYSSNYEVGSELVDAHGVEQFGAVRRDKQCKDDFDGTRYTVPVWSGITVGSEEKTTTVVRIS